jgi:cold shock CspA family protein
MKTKLIGIFVDAENVRNPLLVLPIIRSARNAGSLSAIVLFGNWESPSLSAWIADIVKRELDQVGAVWSPVPKLRPGKNAADIALTFEAALLCRDGKVNEAWIVSGDSDFTPLAQRLQQTNTRVVVFGPKNTPSSLRNACSSFVLLDDISDGQQASVAAHGTGRLTGKTASTKPSQVLSLLRPDARGWFHGFVRRVGERFGYIQVSPQDAIFFHVTGVESPAHIGDLRHGEPVEFKLERNERGPIAVHVRKSLSLKAA